MQRSRVTQLLEALAAEGVAYVLIGGVAMNFHGLVRATEDVDLMIDASEENVARLRSALRRLFRDPDIEQLRAEELQGDYPVVRYGSPDGGLVVDLIARLGERFAFGEVAQSLEEIDGVAVPLATPEALYRMKRATLRPVDASDAAWLRAAFHLNEVDDAD